MRRTVKWLLAGAIVLDVAYWSIWFVDRDVLASEHRAAYYEFENAFPLADLWLGVACLLALLALRRGRPRGAVLAGLRGFRRALPLRDGLPLRRAARHLHVRRWRRDRGGDRRGHAGLLADGAALRLAGRPQDLITAYWNLAPDGGAHSRHGPHSGGQEWAGGFT